MNLRSDALGALLIKVEVVLKEEGGKLHDRLLADAKALAAYELFDGKVLENLEAAAGSPTWRKLRLRAFTLVVRTYNEARTAVGYLRRREGDAESIAPSLFSGRMRKKRLDSEGEATDEPAGGVAPASAPVTTPPFNVPVSGQNGSGASKGPFL